MKKPVLILVTLFISITCYCQTSTITFDDQGHTNNQSIGNPYTIVNNGESFKFTITSSSATTQHRYQTAETSCSSTGISHITAGTFSATSWTIETTSGNEINLGNIKFNNVFSCFSFSYVLSIEGFKNNVSTGSQSFTVAGLNSIFSSNSSFNDVDKVVISSSDLANLGIDDINWEPSFSSPTVTSTAASAIANTSATLAGNVTSNGGATVTERGVVYAKTSQNSNPLISGSGVTKNTNGAGNGVFSESITGLEAGTQYSFKAYAINSVGTSYGAISTFTTTGKGWTGNTNTDWATATNWNPNSIPIASDNIVIPNVANKPIISSSTGAIANNIDVLSGSSLTINDGGSLIVSGIASGSITYNRSVIFSSGNLKGWYLMASPVVGETYDNAYVTANSIANSGTNRGIATYNTSADSWNYLQSGNTGSFNPGQGYSIKRGTNTGNISFTGTLNTNDSGVNVVLNTSGNRFNLLGNPYTSYISSATFLNNEVSISDTKTLWVWNQTLSTNGAYETKNIANDFKIAPSQGFFVQANTGGGTFNFAESNQVHNGTDTFQKTSTKKFNIILSDGTINNYATVYYLNNATTGLDVGYDGEMFSGTANPFAIYTHLVSDNQNKKYQIQSLPDNNYENMIIPIGLNVAAGKEITFSLKDLNLPTNINVFIEDKQTNTVKLLDELNNNYKITTTKTLNGTGRFYIHTSSSILSLNNVELEKIRIYRSNKNILKITGLSDKNTKIKIFNSFGREVLKTSFNSTGDKNISLTKLTVGVYIVQLSTDRIKMSEKIVLE